MSELDKRSDLTGAEIAVIGMAGRFPGAKSIDEFWQNLINGVESVSFFSDDELSESGVDKEMIENPDYVRANNVLEGIEYFDASFFDYTPREGNFMDPQLKVFHEVTWEALENAGYNTDYYEGLVGIYAGADANSQWITQYSNRLENPGEVWEMANLNGTYTFCTRISYRMNLKGPSMTVQTACSTSLVAIHMAVQGLLFGECDMALAGGVSIIWLKNQGYLFQPGMILSHDGHCRPFDARAEGTVFGDGCAVVVLKRLEDAVHDRDRIHVIIKGSASNNDGSRKIGYSAPSMKGQADVIRAAHQVAAIEPETISYIETHGTGTTMGDPIEVSAFKEVFKDQKNGFYRIGSVKSNMGHLNNTAGIAGFLKAVLALEHQLIPPSLHYTASNPEIDFENTPFVVNSELYEWKRDREDQLLRAGVNSIGAGGTNAHVVLEEWPDIKPQTSGSRPYQLILLSAKSESSLDKATENLNEYLKKNTEIDLADAAYTLQLGRKHFHRRKMLVCSDRNEAVDILFSPALGKLFTGNLPAKEKKQDVIFMFPGQGAQYVNMGLGLYRSEKVFQEELDRCFEIYRSLTGSDMKEILYPTHPAPSGQSDDINRTEITQPVIFMLEYALAKLLLSWGIQPSMMIGYSFGEYTAACLSGVFSLEDGLKMIVLRGRLMQQMPPGAMLSVPLPAGELKPLLNEWQEKLTLAIDNGPSCVVSGTTADIDEFENYMKNKRYLCIRVAVSHAGHSTVMGPILSEFEEALKKVELKEPQIPYISNVTAASITSREVMDPGYWLRHLKDTVRFGEGIAGLLAEPDAVFVEIGPGRDLCVLLKSFKEVKSTHRLINLVRHEKEDAPDLYYLLNKVGHLWLYGVNIDWKGFYADEQRCRLPMPTYNFDRQLFEVDVLPMTSTAAPAPGKESKNLLKKKEDIGQWFYIPVWKRSRIARTAEMFTEPQRMQVLLFMDECGLGNIIAAKLKEQGYQVVLVRIGTAFNRIKEDEYSIRPNESKDYEELFNRLTGPGMLPPLAFFHLWNVTPVSSAINEPGGIEWVEKQQDKGFYSLIALVVAMGKQNPNHQFQVKVVTNNVQDVLGGEAMCPEKATLLGPAKVLIQEYSNIDCCTIDIQLPEPGRSWEPVLVERLIGELKIKIQDRMIAYRRNYRWIQTFELSEVAKSENPAEGLKEKGVYLVTGGLGGIGLVLAEHLAREVKAKLILIGRSQFPPREDWDHWLASHGPEEKVSERIQKVRELEALGAEVLVFSADVAQFDHMQQLIEEVKQRFGKINGVIHAAGVADGAMIVRRTREMSEEILAPKVAGTLVLNRLLRESNLDFFMFCSSTSSFVPAEGQTAYSAANAFLDAFALSNLSYNGTNPISVDWDRWKNTGVATIAEEKHKEVWGVEMPGGITPAEGIDVFNRILSDPCPLYAIFPLDLSQAIQEYLSARDGFYSDTYKAEIHHATIHQRPELSVAYVEPGNETEEKLAAVWKNFLGIDRVGIHDNFFELGATSLGIIQVNGRLVHEFGRDIPVVTMYSYPTIAMLAKFLNQENQDADFIEKEKRAFEARDKGQEKKKNLRMRRREAL